MRAFVGGEKAGGGGLEGKDKDGGEAYVLP